MVRKPSQRVEASSTGEIKERKGLWSSEEDERLFNQITRHGVSTWSSVAQLAGKKTN
jgi:transcription factor MYB, plant